MHFVRYPFQHSEQVLSVLLKGCNFALQVLSVFLQANLLHICLQVLSTFVRARGRGLPR